MVEQCDFADSELESDQQSTEEVSSLFSNVSKNEDTIVMKGENSSKDNCEASQKSSPGRQNYATSGNISSETKRHNEDNTQNVVDNVRSPAQIIRNKTKVNKEQADNVEGIGNKDRNNNDIRNSLGSSVVKQENATETTKPVSKADNEEVTTSILDSAGKDPDIISKNSMVEILPESKAEPAGMGVRDRSTANFSHCSWCSCCQRPRCCNYCRSYCYICCRQRGSPMSNISQSSSLNSIFSTNSQRYETGEPTSKRRKIENKTHDWDGSQVINEKKERIYRTHDETIRVYDEEIDIRCKSRCCDKPRNGREAVGPQNATFTVYERTIRPRTYDKPNEPDSPKNETCRAFKTNNKQEEPNRQTKGTCRACRTNDKQEGTNGQSKETCRACRKYDKYDASDSQRSEVCRNCWMNGKCEKPPGQTETCRACKKYDKYDVSNGQTNETFRDCRSCAKCGEPDTRTCEKYRACRSRDKYNGLDGQTNTCRACRSYDKHDRMDLRSYETCRDCRSHYRDDEPDTRANGKSRTCRSYDKHDDPETQMNEPCKVCRSYEIYDGFDKQRNETCRTCRSSCGKNDGSDGRTNQMCRVCRTCDKYNRSVSGTSEISKANNDKTKLQGDMNNQNKSKIRATSTANSTKGTQTNFSNSENNARDANEKATQTFQNKSRATSPTGNPETNELLVYETSWNDYDEGRPFKQKVLSAKRKSRRSKSYKDSLSDIDLDKKLPKTSKSAKRELRNYKYPQSNNDKSERLPKIGKDDSEYKSRFTYNNQKYSPPDYYVDRYHKYPLNQKEDIPRKSPAYKRDKGHSAPSIDKYEQYHHNAYLNYFVRLFRQDKFRGMPATMVAKYAGVQWRRYLSEKEKRPYYEMRKHAPPRVRKKRGK